MNITNPYWRPPFEFQTTKHAPTMAKRLGFILNLPYEQPVTSGYYYGQGQIFPNTRKPQIVTRSDPEYFAASGGVIPTVAGRPQVDIKGPSMSFSRRKFTKFV